MKNLITIFLCLLLILSAAGCGEENGGDAASKSDEDVSFQPVVEAASPPNEVTESAEAPAAAEIPARAFPYRIADREEAVSLYLSNDEYFASLSAYDVQFRTQDKNGTVGQLKEFGAAQMLDFSEEEKELLTAAMDEIEALLQEKEITLPALDELVFIKSTQKEEGAANAYSPSAYTHGTQIYMNNYVPLLLSTGTKNHVKGIGILVHELFHCLTRHDPAFRAEMYGLIGFHISDREFDIPESVRSIMISNPDVEHHDAAAVFTVGGKQRDCYLATVSAQPFEEKGELLGSYMDIVLVPVDADGEEYYSIDDAEDFWEIFGENTAYVLDAEECMAENFSFALAYGLDGSMRYKNPEIISGILELITRRAAATENG